VACRVLPALQPGPHLAVRLLDQRLHPRDALVDDLGYGLAALHFGGLLVAERLGERLAAPGSEAVDLAAGVLDREGLGIVDAEPAGALLAGLPVGELEGEGRNAHRGDADVQARAFAVVVLRPFGDPLLAQAVGQVTLLLRPRLPAGEGTMVVSMWFRLLWLGTKGLGFEAFSLSCGR